MIRKPVRLMVTPQQQRVVALLLLTVAVLLALHWWRSHRFAHMSGNGRSVVIADGSRPRSVADVERRLAQSHAAWETANAKGRPVATRFVGTPSPINGASPDTVADVAMSSVVFVNKNLTFDAAGRIGIPPRPPPDTPRETSSFFVYNDRPSFIVTSEAEYLDGKYRLVSIAQHFNKSWGVTINGVFWTVLNPNPLPRLIFVFDTLSAEECANLIDYSAFFLERSYVNSLKDGRPELNPVRTSLGMFMATPEQQRHPANVKLRSRLASVVGFPVVAAEATQILKYKPHTYYKPHLDTFRPNNKESLRRGGQRTLTAITFLNNCGHGAGGGCETTFPRANVSVVPHTGHSVIFYSLREDFATVDQASLHGGNPPVGEDVKFIAVVWFHPRPFV